MDRRLSFFLLPTSQGVDISSFFYFLENIFEAPNETADFHLAECVFYVPESIM